MIESTYNSNSNSINFCFNCVGWHPDEIPDLKMAIARAQNPNKDAWAQTIKFEQKKIGVYANKSCALCGRSYKPDGELDETFEITAKRVSQELQNAGLFGVGDEKIKLVVAKCRKAVEVLFKNRDTFVANGMLKGDWYTMEKMTFAGQLSYIIVVAQEERARRNSTTIKGSF